MKVVCRMCGMELEVADEYAAIRLALLHQTHAHPKEVPA